VALLCREPVSSALCDKDSQETPGDGLVTLRILMNIVGDRLSAVDDRVADVHGYERRPTMALQSDQKSCA